MVCSEAARVQPDYEGQKIILELLKFLVEEFNKKFYEVRKLFFCVSGRPYIDQLVRENFYELISSEYMKMFVTSNDRLKTSCQKYYESCTSKDVTLLQANDINSVVNESFINTFMKNKFFLSGMGLQIFTATISNVRKAFLTQTPLYSSKNNEVTDVSLGICTHIEIGIAYYVSLYCSSNEMVIKHLHHHMMRASKVTPPGSDVYLRIVTVNELQMEAIMEALSEKFGTYKDNPSARDTYSIVLHDKKEDV